MGNPGHFAPKSFPPLVVSPQDVSLLIVLPPLVVSVMFNLGLNCLNTAKIATYFKGVQVHNVLVLEYVTLET